MRRGLRAVARHLRRAVFGVAACAVQAMTAAAQVQPVPYETLAEEFTGRIDFEEFPKTDEPGHLIAGLYTTLGATIGERFDGQDVRVTHNALGQRFDALSGTPHAPLTALPGAPGQTFSVAAHRGLASLAAFALGPLGYPEIGARGEGAMAVEFVRAQSATGLRVHAGYPDPLGTRPTPGEVHITFYRADGSALARVTHRLTVGVNALAWRFPAHDLAGFSVTTTDPGGLAIDDILYALPAPTS